MNKIEKQLKELENEQKKLAQKREKLILEQKLLEEKQKKLDTLFEQSGYSTPKQFVEELIRRYGIRISSVSSDSTTGKRTRTRITAELRDAIKADISGGNTKMSASKKFGVSYVVVGKIAKGDYDHL